MKLAVSCTCVFAILASTPFGDAFVTPGNNRILSSNQLSVASSSFLNGRHHGTARQPTFLFMEDGPKPPSSEPPEEFERPRVPVPPPSPPSPRRNLTPEEEKLMVAAAIGGLFLGGFVGGVIDLQNPDIDLYVSPIVPPAIGALSLATFGFVAGGSDGSLGNIVRKTLGSTTIAVGNGIVAVIRNAADSAATAAKNKVKETTDEIKAIPSNIQKAAVRKVEQTKEEIIAIPGKIQEAAVETATEIAEEIKATPGRVAESTKRAVEDAVDDTLDAVEEFVDDVKALPKKALSEVEESINALLGKDPVPRPPLAPPEKPKTSRRKDRTPGPPKALPPIEAEKKPLIPRIESLKIEPPRLEVPKIEPPKIEVPKIEAPKFEVPRINIPKPPAVKPPPPKAKPPPAKAAPPTPSQSESILDKVKLQSGKKDIFFDEKTGRFFEGGKTPAVEAPKFEAPKLELPKLEVPKFNLPKSDPKPPTTRPPVDAGADQRAQAAKQAEEKRKAQAAQKAAQEAAAQKQKQEAEARAQEARQRKEEAERKKAEAAEKARQEAEERKRVQEQARQEKLEEEAKAAELRQQQVEERRRQVEAIRQAQLDKNQKAKEARQAAALKVKRQQAAEKSLDTSSSRTKRSTISLGSLFGFGSSDEDTSPTVPVPSGSRAPPGVPTINNWKQNPDGSITGKITGSTNFAEGEAVTTSPVPIGAASGTVVKTSSGSRYFLGSKGGGFGFSFGGSAPAPAVDTAAEARRIAEEKKAAAEAAAAERKAAAEAAAEKRRQEAEERKAAAAAAAEERKAAAEAQRRAAEERKTAAAAAAEERKAAAEAQKKAAEERKAAALAAAEEKKRAAEERQAAMAAAAEAKQREAAERQAAMAAAAEEKKRAAEARRAAAVAAVERRKTPPTPAVESPPGGVPVIKSWKRRPDGGVSGRIYNSRSFSDGDFVETSPITKGNVENGSVVATKSGSRYFLSAEPAVKNSNILAAIKDLAGAEPGATITLTRERKEKEAKAAQEAIEKAKPRSTFSLFGLGFGDADEDPSPAPAPKPAPKQAAPKKVAPATKAATAPRGVPTVSRWKKNSDGSITGIITGSKAFNDGERVTTSAIKNGKIAKNEVVITGSGSKYFLA